MIQAVECMKHYVLPGYLQAALLNLVLDDSLIAENNP